MIYTLAVDQAAIAVIGEALGQTPPRRRNSRSHIRMLAQHVFKAQ